MKQSLYTDITILLDRSGSMFSIKDDTVGGFNNFISSQKKLKGKTDVTLVQFDDKYEVNYTAINLDGITGLNFSPRGNTALLDALGKSITETGERLANLNPEDRPQKVLFIVITDGQENSSKEFKKAQIAEMVQHQKSKYNWDFVFLGANLDAIKEGSNIGVRASNAINYTANSKSVGAVWNKLSDKMTTYRSCINDSFDFSDQDRKDLGVK